MSNKNLSLSNFVHRTSKARQKSQIKFLQYLFTKLLLAYAILLREREINDCAREY